MGRRLALGIEEELSSLESWRGTPAQLLYQWMPGLDFIKLTILPMVLSMVVWLPE